MDFAGAHLCAHENGTTGLAPKEKSFIIKYSLALLFLLKQVI